MKKLIIICLTFLSLATLANRNPASTPDRNGTSSRSPDDPSKTSAGTNVIGLDCAECKTMETAGQTKLLGDTSTIFRGDNANSGSSTSTTSSEPDNTGQ